MNKYLQVVFSIVVVLLAVFTITRCNKSTRDLIELPQELNQDSNSLNIPDTVSDQELNAKVVEVTEAKIQAPEVAGKKNLSNTPKGASQVINSQKGSEEMKIFLNDKEIKLQESKIDLEFSHEKILITHSDKSIFEYKYFERNNTQNGNFYSGFGAVFNANDERMSSNPINFRSRDCDQEAGHSFYLLEDGEGFVSVCESRYVRVFRMKDNKFENNQNSYWEIKSKRSASEDYFGREVGLTQDGKYLFVAINENPKKIRKYDLDTKEMVWEKVIDNEYFPYRIYPSPYSDLILINGSELYDKDLNKIETFRFDEMQDVRAYPKFFITDGVERLLVKGNNCLWILNLNNIGNLRKISTSNSDRIDWFQLYENKLLFQIKTEENIFNLIELNLENLPISVKGKIMRSSVKYTKGSKNTIVKIDGTSYKIYNY